MDTAPERTDKFEAPRTATVDATQRALDREAGLIAEADADIAAGRLIEEAAIDAWIDSIGTRHELPPPRAGR